MSATGGADVAGGISCGDSSDGFHGIAGSAAIGFIASIGTSAAGFSLSSVQYRRKNTATSLPVNEHNFTHAASVVLVEE